MSVPDASGGFLARVRRFFGGSSAGEADPPFRVGQLVRCNARTFDRGDAFHRLDLFGRRGTVVRVGWLALESDPPGYWLVVVDDDLGSAVQPWHHRSTDLVADEDWWRR